jgi:hypothetical protein
MSNYDERKTIYIITTIKFGYKYLDNKVGFDGKFHSYSKKISKDQRKYFTIIDSRTCGWFFKFENAEETIFKNYYDIHEECYNYAIIEECKEGLFGSLDEKLEHWYKWKDGRYKSAQKPKEYKGIVDFHA